MRRILFLAAPFALALFAFACEDDPLNNPDATLPEAGAFDANRPGFDSSVPESDAGTDVDSALPPQPVTVVVANRKGPRQGIAVVFSDAAGAILETKTTDATGRATSNAAGPIPAMATALLAKDNGYARQILTWTGVEAGDELVAAEPEEYMPIGNFSIELPGLLLDAGGGVAATTYEARLGDCTDGNSASPISLFVNEQCTGPLNAPLVIAYDDSTTPIGFAFKKGVAAPDGGALTVNGLTGWTAVNDFTVTVQNPPGVAPLSAELLEIANNIATQNYSAYSLSGNEAKFKVAPGYAEAYQAGIRYYDSGKSRRMVTRFAPAATSATFDFQQALPEITDVTVDATDAKRPSLTWTATSSLAGTDGGYVRAWVYFSNEDTTAWTIIVPPGNTTGTVKAPILPAAEAAPFLPNPDAGPENWSDAEALFGEADALPDYKAFKKFQGIVNQAQGTPRGYLPANGSMKTTAKEPYNPG